MRGWGMVAAVVALATCVSAAETGRIERRKTRQQRRIANGEASGQLSPQETERLEKQEGAINKEEQAMREANGGRLSAGERRVINKQQNRLSRRIHRQKHDLNDR